MGSIRTKRTVLVPIIGSDISEETLALATSLLAPRDSRLVLLHVTPALQDGADLKTSRRHPPLEPRWRRLALTAAPNRTFVEAVSGDPGAEILAQAERFHTTFVVLGPTAMTVPANGWIEHAIAQLVSAPPQQVYSTDRRSRPSRTTRLPHPNARRASHQRRSHAAQPRVRLAAPAGHR